MDEELDLAGGNASGAVVRVGSTVRKPWTESSESVHAFMEAVRAQGVDVPAPLGRDERGRQVIEFVPGQLAMHRNLTLVELRRVGAIVRAIHEASADFVPARDAVWETAIPAPSAEFVCHNDLAPWNLIVGDRWVFIDWDAAAPSTRLWDLAYAAQAFALSDVDRSPEDAAGDLAAFVDGYRADAALRDALPTVMHRRAAAMVELLRSGHETGREPWASMFAAGHGDHWAAVTQYVASNQAVWSDALGLTR
jgi:Ser/Thr protein kinase RdoA (MazF antagonist)